MLFVRLDPWELYCLVGKITHAGRFIYNNTPSETGYKRHWVSWLKKADAEQVESATKSLGSSELEDGEFFDDALRTAR